MRRFTFLTAAAIAATVFLVSCKDSAISGLDIPKDAAAVVHINTSSLTSKLSWDEIKNSGWFKERAGKEDDSLAKKLMENPENSGIDMKSDFVFFTRKQGQGGYAVFEGKLKDAALFEKTLQQMDKDAEVVKEGGLGFKYMNLGSRQMISWTDSKFIMMSNYDFEGNMQVNAMGGRWERDESSFTTDSLKHFTKELLNLKSSAQLEKDSRFSDLLKQTGDVHFWVNADPIIASAYGDYLSMFKAGALLEGNALSCILNFEDGRISFKSKTYYGKDMARLMEKNKPKTIDAALLNRIPSNDVVGFMAFNFDPAFIMELFKATGSDGIVNGELGKMNLSLSEVTGALKGQFMFAVSDLQPGKTQDEKSVFFEKNANVLVATSVNNRSTFDKLIGMFKDKMDKDTTAKYHLTNDWFAVSNKKATLDQFVAGANNPQPFADKITGNTFGMYVDLQKVFKSFAYKVKDAGDSASYDASVKMWQDVVGKDGEFVINLVDKSKNSLKQLNEYVDKMNAAMELKKKKWMTADGEYRDSVQVDAPAEVMPSN